MCGIVVTIGKSHVTRNLDSWFRDAMIASQVRGIDSTGMFIKKKSKGIEFTKEAVCAVDFLKRQDVKSMMTRMDDHQLTVGHVRHATAGSVTDDNAHPFVVQGKTGEVVGVHNGSLTGWRPTTGTSPHEVDSEWALQLIADKGVDAFKEINGAYCFVWTNNSVEDTLYMARNKDRPFHFAIVDRGDALVGCSEDGMLDWLLDKHDLNPVDNEIYSLEPGVLYKVNLKTLNIETEKLEVPVVTIGNPSGGYWQNGKWYQTGSAYSSTTSTYRSEEQRIIEGVDKLIETHVAKEDTPGADDEKEEGEDRVPFAIGPMLSVISEQPYNPAWDLINNVMKVSIQDDTVAGKQEVKEAKDHGFYGRAVFIDPVLWDDSLECLMCEAQFADEHDDTKVIKMDCMLFGISAAQADKLYFEPNQPGAAAIVGYSKPYTDGEYLIAVPLSAAQEKFLRDWDMDATQAA